MQTPQFIHKPLTTADDYRRNWKTINRHGAALERTVQGLATAQKRVGELAPRAAALPSHPFEIYVYPPELRPSPAAEDWRTVRVRAGTVFVDWQEVTVTGTDGLTNPDNPELSTSGDIVCTAATAKYWLWLQLAASTASVQHGATPPTWDSSHIPLGWVDTQTYSADSRVVIRQFIRTDLFACL
jgi:hypothetical protein